MTKLELVAKLLLLSKADEGFTQKYLQPVNVDYVMSKHGYILFDYESLPTQMVEIRNDGALSWTIDLSAINTDILYVGVSDWYIASSIADYIANDIHYGVEKLSTSNGHITYSLHIMSIPSERYVKAILRFEGFEEGFYAS